MQIIPSNQQIYPGDNNINQVFPNQPPLQYEVDPYQMNTQVANGFGVMFYNMNDP